MAAKFGDIRSDIDIPAGRAIRRKADDTGFEAYSPGGGGPTAWGDITGTLAAQTDLSSVLDGKTTLVAVKADADIADAIAKKHANTLDHSNSLDHSNANDPTASEKLALAGTSGIPSGTNKFMTDGDARNSNARTPTSHSHSPSEVTGTAVITTDSRLSDARTPTAHSHTPSEAGAEPANANIQTHVTSAHAPSNAQKNSDIIQSEIEAKLVGQINTHTHAGGVPPELWMGKVHAAYNDGDPYDGAAEGLSSAVASSPAFTPTNIGSAVGRLAAFRFVQPITVVTIRWYGIAAVTGIYTAAIYRDSDGARLRNPGAINTLANAWSSAVWAQTLAADTLYWFGISANTTGTTAGFCGPNRLREAAVGLATPAFAGLSTIGMRWCQVALTAGAWPITLPSKVNVAAWTGSVPIFFLCATGQ